MAEVADLDLALHDTERFHGGSMFQMVAHVRDDRSLAGSWYGGGDGSVEVGFFCGVGDERRTCVLTDLGAEDVFGSVLFWASDSSSNRSLRSICLLGRTR